MQLTYFLEQGDPMRPHVYSMMAIIVIHKNNPSRNAHAPLHCLMNPLDLPFEPK